MTASGIALRKIGVKPPALGHGWAAHQHVQVGPVAWCPAAGGQFNDGQVLHGAVFLADLFDQAAERPGQPFHDGNGLLMLGRMLCGRGFPIGASPCWAAQ
jgi:hypothetical protein